MVVSHDLFEAPVAHEGLPHAKGTYYLVAVFAESEWGKQRIEAALEELQKIKVKVNIAKAWISLHSYVELIMFISSSSA